MSDSPDLVIAALADLAAALAGELSVGDDLSGLVVGLGEWSN